MAGTQIGEVNINLRLSLARFKEDVREGAQEASRGTKQMSDEIRKNTQEGKASLALLGEEIGMSSFTITTLWTARNLRRPCVQPKSRSEPVVNDLPFGFDMDDKIVPVLAIDKTFSAELATEFAAHVNGRGFLNVAPPNI